MINADHPFFFLKQLFGRKKAVFEFSRYIYKPDSLFDEREYLSVPSSELTLNWMLDAFKSLNGEQELALHSKVVIAGRTYHIPMIDFSTPELTAKHISRVRAFLPKKIFSSCAYFRSGRSFHAYANQLLKPKDWLEFMGRLLLINGPDARQVVDSRWVGHRLISASALQKQLRHQWRSSAH